MKTPFHIQQETSFLKTKSPENSPTLVPHPSPHPDDAHGLQKLLALVQALPTEAAAKKSFQLTEMIAALELCDEIPVEELQTSTSLLTQMSAFFRRQSAAEMGKCFLALGIKHTRFYRLIGSLEDYSDSISVCRQTFTNWTYFAEIAQQFGKDARGLALPSTTEQVTKLRNLPQEHRVPCWQGYLAMPGARIAGRASLFKTFLAAYRRENGLSEEKGNKPSKPDSQVTGIESLDEFLEPELLARFRSQCPDLSPCLSTILGSVTVDLGEAERATLRRAAKCVDRMREENSDDYQTFVYFGLRILMLTVRRQTSEVIANFDPIPEV